MYLASSFVGLLVLITSVSAEHRPAKHADLHKRSTPPDNTCGPKNGFSCDPNSPNGGPCCSGSGYCGIVDYSNTLNGITNIVQFQVPMIRTAVQDANPVMVSVVQVKAQAQLRARARRLHRRALHQAQAALGLVTSYQA